MIWFGLAIDWAHRGIRDFAQPSFLVRWFPAWDGTILNLKFVNVIMSLKSS